MDGSAMTQGNAPWLSHVHLPPRWGITRLKPGTVEGEAAGSEGAGLVRWFRTIMREAGNARLPRLCSV